jgi:hypothetical protein
VPKTIHRDVELVERVGSTLRLATQELRGPSVSTDSPNDVQAELARLRAENERLKAGRANARERITVSPKGAVSVYGLGRFPITLYQEQWLRLLAMADAIRQFIVDHKSELKVKDPSGE